MLRGRAAAAAAAAEPTPPATEACDAVPDELQGDDVAAAEWTRNAPMLRRCGILTDADLPLLLTYCRTWSQYVATERRVRVDGMTEVRPSGIRCISADVQLMDKLITQLRQLWDRLGLTPVGRAKMASNAPKPPARAASKWAGLLP